MNKKELVSEVAKASGVKQHSVESVLDALGNVIRDEMANGNDISLNGIGKLVVKDRKARKGCNPKTGKAITIPAKKVVAFKASKALRDAVEE